MDLAPPILGSDYVPGTAWKATATHNVSVDTTDNAKLNPSSAEIGIGTAANNIVYRPANFTGTTETGRIYATVTAPSQGTWLVGFRIRDAAGNIATSTRQLRVDLTAPSGAIDIEESIVRHRVVTLKLTASDALSGVANVRISNTAGTGTWQPFTPGPNPPDQMVSAWTLDDSDGLRTVYTNYRDAVGHVSTTYQDTVLLDRRAPVFGTLTPTHESTGVPTTATIRALWGDDTSATSDVAGIDGASRTMTIQDLSNGLPPIDVTAQTTWDANGISYKPLAPLLPSNTYRVVVTVKDLAGNGPSSTPEWVFRTGGL